MHLQDSDVIENKRVDASPAVTHVIPCSVAASHTVARQSAGGLDPATKRKIRLQTVASSCALDVLLHSVLFADACTTYGYAVRPRACLLPCVA